MTVVSFIEYTPAPRFDGLPWTDARIEGAESQSGPWAAVETIAITPVDADPSDPAARSFTTEDALSTQTWFRIVFLDATGDTSTTSPVRYPGAAAGSMLTSLAAVRAHLQKSPTDTGQDATIESLIESASWTIIQRYGKFRPTESTAVKTFVWDGGHRLNLFPYYLRSVDSVVLDETSPTTLTTDDYQLRPTSPLDDVYKWIRLPNHQAQVERQVTVTGDWGYETVPFDVEQACVITVVEWMRRGVQAFGTSYESDEATLAPAGLPMAAKRLLAPYDRHGQG